MAEVTPVLTSVKIVTMVNIRPGSRYLEFEVGRLLEREPREKATLDVLLSHHENHYTNSVEIYNILIPQLTIMGTEG